MAKKSLLVLAVDIGTTWIKSALFDSGGRTLPGSLQRSAQPIQHGPDGRAEIDPLKMRRAFWKCVEKTLADATGPVAAVSTSCFWHGLLGVGPNGKPVTPIYPWADSRSVDQARRMRRELSERKIHRRTGCMIHSSYWPAKLLWLQEDRPRLFEAAHRWMSPAEWLQTDFCGATVCSYGMASGTGLFNPSTLKWDRPLLTLCGLSEGSLNPLSQEPMTVKKAPEQFPALQGAAWHPAIGDGAASNLGCGTQDQEAALNLGTSAALRIVKHDVSSVPLGLFRYRVDGSRSVVGGAVSNAGNLRQWCEEHLRLPEHERDLEKALAGPRWPNHGLSAFPFWSGERFPHWDDRVPAAVFGFRQSTSALDLLRVLMEAVHHRLAMILESLERLEKRQLQVIVSGGATRSPATLRGLADVLGRAVTPCRAEEISLRGAAVYVLERLGFSPEPPRRKSPVEPDPQAAGEYRAARRRWLQLEGQLRRIFD